MVLREWQRKRYTAVQHTRLKILSIEIAVPSRIILKNVNVTKKITAVDGQGRNYIVGKANRIGMKASVEYNSQHIKILGLNMPPYITTSVL